MVKILMSLGLALGLMSCSKSTKDEGLKVLHKAAPQKIKGFDPIFSNDLYSNNQVALVYEGLLEYHYLKRPYTLQPNLAESMPQVSKDGLTYTFKIKKGVMFQDDAAFPGGKGRELVAADFVYSLKRLADPKLQALGWWVIKDKIAGLNEWRDKYAKADTVNYDEEVEGLRALDKYTLQFKLKKQYPQFLNALAMGYTVAVAREAVEKYGKEFLNHPVGTGPFVLPLFKQTNKIVYTKNPNYRTKLFPSEGGTAEQLADAGKKLPLVDKIVVNVMVESQPRWLSMQKGKIDYMQIPKDNFDTAVNPGNTLSEDLKKRGIALMISPKLDITYSAFNHDLDLFGKNKYLRQAIMLAYDIDEANKLFYNGTALPAQSIIPPGIAGYDKNFKNPFRGPDVEKAKELLAKAGYPNGKGLPEITYDCPVSSVSRQLAEYFKKRMKLIGINIKVRQSPWPEFMNKIVKREVQLYGIAWGADYPDAENFLQLLYGPNRSPGANGSGYDNPVFNELYRKASVMQDSPERTALYTEMNKMAAEEVPWVYGVHRQNFTLKHGWLKNFVQTDFESGREVYLNVDMGAKAELIKSL